MINSFSFIFDSKLDYHEGDIRNSKNPIYKAVEKLFFNLSLDKENFGRSNWNPLKTIVKPGNTVAIKPNFVASRDKELNLSDNELLSVSTSPSVLRPIIDYCWKALMGKGKIIIVDSPVEGTDFHEILNRLHMYDLIDILRNKKINIEIIDLRDFTFIRKMLLDNFIFGDYSINIGLLIKKDQKGDPKGYKIIDLKEKSFLAKKGWNYGKLRFHRANPKTPTQYHDLLKNLYSISKSVLESDVFINVPKLKTHKKSGVTLSLKSLIGITNRKHWLPHYRSGCPPSGDEYPRRLSLGETVHQKLSRFPLPFGHSLILNIINRRNHQKAITEGSWEGNDTLWRVILDLNKILFFADKKGKIKNTFQRKYLTIIDGVRAGEGDGPLRPTPKHTGILVAAFNPAVADALATNIMGLNYKKIPQIMNALDLFNLNMDNLNSLIDTFNKNNKINLRFKPPAGWEKIIKDKYV